MSADWFIDDLWEAHLSRSRAREDRAPNSQYNRAREEYRKAFRKAVLAIIAEAEQSIQEEPGSPRGQE